MQRGNDCAVRERERPVAKGLDRNIVAQLGAQLFQVASCQAGDRDQAPVTVSGRNCDAIDRGGMTLSLRLALLALCRGFRDVQSANGDCGANAQSTEKAPGGRKCHDLLPVGARLTYADWLSACRISIARSSVSGDATWRIALHTEGLLGVDLGHWSDVRSALPRKRNS